MAQAPVPLPSSPTHLQIPPDQTKTRLIVSTARCFTASTVLRSSPGLAGLYSVLTCTVKDGYSTGPTSRLGPLMIGRTISAKLALLTLSHLFLATYGGARARAMTITYSAQRDKHSVHQPDPIPENATDSAYLALSQQPNNPRHVHSWHGGSPLFDKQIRHQRLV